MGSERDEEALGEVPWSLTFDFGLEGSLSLCLPLPLEWDLGIGSDFLAFGFGVGLAADLVLDCGLAARVEEEAELFSGGAAEDLAGEDEVDLFFDLAGEEEVAAASESSDRDSSSLSMVRST